MTRRTSRGFTLLEVMIGLALLGLALTVLIKSAAGSIFNAEQAHMMGIVTDLARAKMYDIEEVLLKDGFTDTDQSQESEECFTDEGWPNVCYSYSVKEPEMPTLEELSQMGQAKAERLAAEAGSAGSAALGSDGEPLVGGGDFANSALGGMMAQIGMDPTALTSGVESAAAGSMLQSQYQMFQEVLKVSIRKVTLTVTWSVLGSKRDMKVVAYFTDPLAMNKTLLGQMTGALEASGAQGEPPSPTPGPAPSRRGGNP